MSERYSVAVLGGGPGGYVAALRAAQAGLRVVLIEKSGIGGTCLHRGCIPTKALLASSELYGKLKESEEFGVLVSDFSFHMPKALERKNRLVAELTSGIETLLKKRKVTVLRGTGHLESANRISISYDDKEFSGDGICSTTDESSNTAACPEEIEADHIIIATGSKPTVFPGFEVDGSVVMTSNHILDCPKLPESLIIVGGGVIGCEFATFYSSLGVNVILIEALKRLLLPCDKSLAKQVELGLKRAGVTIKTGTKIKSLSNDNGKALACLDNGEIVEAQMALLAVGRRAVSEGIGLDKARVERDSRGLIKVDSQMRTNVPNIFAIGDVTGGFWLAHVASAQGEVAASVISGNESFFDGSVVPSVVFCKPELAQVGLTDEECKEKGLNVVTGRFMFGANGKSLAIGEGQGSIKILSDKDTGKIYGAHILGPHASDLIPEIALAMRNNLPISGICKTIHSHPTLNEVVHEAAEAAMGTPLHQV